LIHVISALNSFTYILDTNCYSLNLEFSIIHGFFQNNRFADCKVESRLE